MTTGYELDDAVRTLTKRVRTLELAVARNRPASGSLFDDVGGGLGGGLINLQDVIDAILNGSLTGYLRSSGGEVHVIDTSHATLNGTSIWDLANGNVHPGTLTGSTTISTVGWPAAGTRGWLQWVIEGDGSSIPTFSGVTWDGQDPPGVIGAGEFLHGALWSDDAGTVIWGGYRGVSTSSDGLVPYLIEAGETFTVPVKKQALKAMPITIDAGGSLVVDGFLLEVA